MISNEPASNSTTCVNVTADDVTDDDVTPRRSLVELLSIATALATIVFVTVAGNLLVIATVWTNRSMHNVTNYFLVSLATTDLLLGCVVLPLSAVNTLSPRWPFGAVFCNVYISCDVMLCTVSILTLFAISLDRYFAITAPFRYRNRMKSGIVWRISAGIWTFAAGMAFVPIHLGWNSADGRIQNADRPEGCSLGLNGPYALLVSLGTYFGPLVTMSVVYVRVLQITRRQVKEINKLGRLAKKTTNAGNQTKKPSDGHSPQTNRRSADNPSVRHSVVVSDRKAIVNLASVVLAFAVCWIPYFVLFTLRPFVDLQLTSGFGYHFELFALWLGYTNSSINPFIYAFYSTSFRNGFRRLLCRGGGSGGWTGGREYCSGGGGGEFRSCDVAPLGDGTRGDVEERAPRSKEVDAPGEVTTYHAETASMKRNPLGKDRGDEEDDEEDEEDAAGVEVPSSVAVKSGQTGRGISQLWYSLVLDRRRRYAGSRAGANRTSAGDGCNASRLQLLARTRQKKKNFLSMTHKASWEISARSDDVDAAVVV